MSDPWESQYGFSTTGNANPDQAPAADPDGGGVSNLLESIAGTDPLSASPPLGLHQLTFSPNVANPLSFDLHWQQFIGKQYQVQDSTSLNAGDWAPLASPYTAATAIPASYTTPPRSLGFTRNFYRTSVVDVDPDSDGLTSSEEHTLGTNPDLADSDGDGTPDKAEIIQGSRGENRE